VRRLVNDAVPSIIGRAGTDGLVALALVGSAARGEETWQGDHLVSDLDILAVTSAFFAPRLASDLSTAAAGTNRNISIGCSPTYSLRRYRTLEFYGAKRDGWVLWGAADAFSGVRMTGPGDIPPWEAIRLVLNRAVDILRGDAGLIAPWYVLVKMYLALWEAELVMAGSYDPSYRKQKELLGYADTVLGDRELRNIVHAATAVKLDGADPRVFRQGSEAHKVTLVRGLNSLVSRYVARDIEVLDALGMLSAGHNSMPHRLYYLARHANSPRHWARAIKEEPAFWYWRKALEVLMGRRNPSRNQLLRFLEEFDRTHQPLPR
jgi:hypothetical protein